MLRGGRHFRFVPTAAPSQCLNNDLACVLFVYLPQALLEWPRLCEFRFRECLGAGQTLETDLEIKKRPPKSVYSAP